MVEGLLELAVDAEQTLENFRTYRPPLQPAATLLPEMANKPPPYAEPQRKPKEDAKEGKVDAAVDMEDPESEDLEELLRRVIKQSFAEMASSSVEHPKKHASAGPCRDSTKTPRPRATEARPRKCQWHTRRSRVEERYLPNGPSTQKHDGGCESGLASTKSARCWTQERLQLSWVQSASNWPQRSGANSWRTRSKG